MVVNGGGEGQLDCNVAVPKPTGNGKPTGKNQYGYLHLERRSLVYMPAANTHRTK